MEKFTALIIVVVLLFVYLYYFANIRCDEKKRLLDESSLDESQLNKDKLKQIHSELELNNPNAEMLSENFMPVEQEWKTSRYAPKALWDTLKDNSMNIINGDSTHEFAVGNKMRITMSNDKLLWKDLDRKNLSPFVYLETSCNGDDFKIQPKYSCGAKEIDFTDYNTVVMKTPNGNLTFKRYPNNTIWMGNEHGEGYLRNVQLSLDTTTPSQNTFKKIDLRDEKSVENGADERFLSPYNSG